MDYRILGLPSFAVLGRSATGPSADAPDWVPKLWGASLQTRNELVGIELGECWGLMGMPQSPLASWKDHGTYLAGWEVPRDTVPPEGWVLWLVPASAWIRISVTALEISQGHEFLGGWLEGQTQWVAAGACHEHYPATFRNPETDSLHLCLPLELAQN